MQEVILFLKIRPVAGRCRSPYPAFVMARDPYQKDCSFLRIFLLQISHSSNNLKLYHLASVPASFLVTSAQVIVRQIRILRFALLITDYW